MRVRVIKLGGSLFDLVDWPRRLVRWISEEPPRVNVIVAGGGEMVEAIRRMDRTHHLDESSAHWLCIRAMSMQAQMVVELLRREIVGRSTATFTELIEWSAELGDSDNAIIVFDAHEFLRGEEPKLPGVTLPHGWQVTSDSIAARLAACLDRAELVLMKSATADTADLYALSLRGFVDSYFPTAAAGLKVRLVNLREG